MRTAFAIWLVLALFALGALLALRVVHKRRGPRTLPPPLPWPEEGSDGDDWPQHPSLPQGGPPTGRPPTGQD